LFRWDHCRILREQEYIEDPTLASPDAIMFAIRSTNSLGQYVTFISSAAS
jgi:hypothetical protein